MGIINGTFDTDLSGWTPTINGNADVIWDNGTARLRIYRCSNASMQQTFVIGETISFNYTTRADNWVESPGWKLIVDGVVVIDEGFSVPRAGQMSGTVSKDVSVYKGKTATVQFTIVPSQYCSNSDHGNTYLWIDNITSSCTPNWQCEPGQTGYEVDGCGNRRENPACLPPANIISATLTVDTNDCVVPCTVNGTVSWTNTGGTASDPTDLGITVSRSSTTVGSAVTIIPGETKSYTFSLPGLAAGTYVVEASPNTGTTPQTITVRTPSNIVATAITPSVTTCIEPCDLTINVTWTNNGGVADTFTPTIIVNGTPTTLPEGSLDPGASITKTFSLTKLMVGTYTICSDPNTFPCVTVTVTSVAQAGFGGAGMVLIAGLTIGVLYATTKKQKTEELI